jgi:transposase
MPLVCEMRHPKSMDFQNEKKVVLLRDVQGMEWEDIRKEVQNLEGMRPSLSLIQRAYKEFNTKQGRRVYKYANCGNVATKVTEEVGKFLIHRLKVLRKKWVVTSTTLQRELFTARNVKLEASTIRKVLRKHGYKWLPKAQKRKYSPERMAERLKFAKAVLRLSRAQLRERLSFSMDGVVLSLPPKDATHRFNYCAQGETHMWRLPGEAASPELAGKEDYPAQLDHGARAVPMWGGLSEGGFSVVAFHKRRKFNTAEWVKVVRSGKLANAIRALDPVLADGPWYVLCDNESFLTTADSTTAHEEAGVIVWNVPASSPDLNPVEQMWAWLRKQLLQKDREDLNAKRPPIQRTAFQARVRSLLATQKARRVASRIAGGFRKKCQEVVKKKGAMARG